MRLPCLACTSALWRFARFPVLARLEPAPQFTMGVTCEARGLAGGERLLGAPPTGQSFHIGTPDPSNCAAFVARRSQSSGVLSPALGPLWLILGHGKLADSQATNDKYKPRTNRLKPWVGTG